MVSNVTSTKTVWEKRDKSMPRPKRRTGANLRYYDHISKSVSMSVQTAEAIDALSKKTGKSFSEIVEDCCHGIVSRDEEYFKLLAIQAAQDLAKWNHLAKTARDIKEIHRK